ncbi:hypothetical protein ACHAXN_002736 [Cyclotella atomus]
MDELASQIAQISSHGGLKIDLKPLESVLLGIAQELKNHEVIFSKLPEIEAVLSGLRRDLNKLRVALELAAAQEQHYDDNTLLESNDADSVIPSISADATTQNSYGLRKDSIDPIRLRRAEQNDKTTEAAMANGLRDAKAKIRQLQQDRDESLANSLEVDGTIRSIRNDLLKMQQKLAASISTSQLHTFQQSLAAKHSQVEAHLTDFQSKFREEVHQSINEYLADIKSSFSSLETFLRQRQDKTETRVALCAKEYDVAAFRDDVESNVTSLMNKTAFLDDTARAQGKALAAIQQKNALSMFHRRFSEWKRNALKLGMSQWKQSVRRQARYEKNKVSQKRVMKKILTNIMSRRKRIGFEKWIKYRNWHRETERLKIKATSLVCERLKIYLTSSKTEAFNKWRRMAVAHKMKCSRSSGKVGSNFITGELENHSEGEAASLTESRQNQYDLHAIVDSLKNDSYGASCALAQELKNVKQHDLAALRRDVIDGHQHLMSVTVSMVDDAVQKIDISAQELRTSLTRRLDGCDAQFHPIYSQLKELNNLLQSHKTQLKNIEESNRKRFDILFHYNDSLEKRLSVVEELANNTSSQVASMMEEQSKSSNAIQQLNQVISLNEARREEESTALREVMDRFGDELLRTKVTLGHTQVRCETLESELAITKKELAHFQDVSQSQSEKVSASMNQPGIRQPNLDRIVRVGHAYENLAKEKNYVTGINVMATMICITGPSMKSDGEKLQREEQVDIPAEIAAFAHDYAEWIAYQADHESLLRLIAGTNPDEQVYAEDDIFARRKILLEELKTNLSTELERVSYPGVVDPPDATTRGLGLRWEARAIFLARIMDATKAALTKHDHLSLPGQTRLGRSRPASANVTVCVACDRPMRKKSSHDQRPESVRENRGEKSSKKMKEGQQGQNNLLESSPTVHMRFVDTNDSISTRRLQSAASVSNESSKQLNAFGLGEHFGSQSDLCVTQRSASAGRLVRGSHLAESIKENSMSQSNDLFA